MVIYTAVLLIVSIIISLSAIRQEGKPAIYATIIGLSLELPIFGRIFGWW